MVDGVIWTRGGEEGEERMTSLVVIQRLRVHPAPVFCFAQEMNDSSVGNQDHSPSPLCCKKNMWDWGERKIHFSSASIYPCLPQGRQEPCTDLGSLVPQDIAQVPALLKAVAFALERPGTRHVGFSVRKIGVRFFCHW